MTVLSLSWKLRPSPGRFGFFGYWTNRERRGCGCDDCGVDLSYWRKVTFLLYSLHEEDHAWVSALLGSLLLLSRRKVLVCENLRPTQKSDLQGFKYQKNKGLMYPAGQTVPHSYSAGKDREEGLGVGIRSSAPTYASWAAIELGLPELCFLLINFIPPPPSPCY